MISLLFLHGITVELLITVVVFYLVLVVILYLILKCQFFKLDFLKSISEEISNERKIGHQFLIK